MNMRRLRNLGQRFATRATFTDARDDLRFAIDTAWDADHLLHVVDDWVRHWTPRLVEAGAVSDD